MSNIKNDSSSSSDESLDPTSDKFDALKALYSQKVKLPMPNAHPLDNIAKYDSVMKQSKRKEELNADKGTERQPGMDIDGASQSKTSAVPKKEYQRFLPHQQMVPGKARKPQSNLLKRMDTVPPPLRRLREAAATRCRVRVVTRDEHGVRGRLEGYVVLFDKHWNLAMADVTEVFYRSAPRRAKDFFVGDPQRVSELSERLADLGVSERLPGRGRGRGRGRGLVKREGGAVVPGAAGVAALAAVATVATASLPDPLQLVSLDALSAGAVQSRGKGRGKRTQEALADWPPLPKVFWRWHGKRQECVRHMNQVLVRGEHVVYVQLLPIAQQDAETEAKTHET